MVLCTVSCEDGGNSSGSSLESGELGYVRFEWICRGDGDLACEPEYEDELPERLALGATFDLDFSLHSRVPNELSAGYLELASPEGVSESSFDYETTAEGRVTVIALTSDGEVADFARFEVRAVEDLRVVQDCDTVSSTSGCGEPVELTQNQGDILEVRVEPYASGAPLMGNLDYEWEVVRPEAEIENEIERLAILDGDGNSAQFELLLPGQAEVLVRHAGLEERLQFTILATGPIDSSGPQRTRPGEEDTDTDSTGGETDTDTDTDTDGSTGSTGGAT